MLRVALGSARHDLAWTKKASALQFHSPPASSQNLRYEDATRTTFANQQNQHEHEVCLKEGSSFPKNIEGKVRAEDIV
jgi:hypothetical protein